MPLTNRPSCAEWLAHLSQPGPDGGTSAKPVHDYKSLVSERFSHASTWSIPPITDEIRKRVDDDMVMLRKGIKTARTRRAGPSWSPPAELWRMCMFPKSHEPSKFQGIGCHDLLQTFN